MLAKVFIGGRRIANHPRVGRNGIQRVLAPELPDRSSNMLRTPVRCFLDHGTFGMLMTYYL